MSLIQSSNVVLLVMAERIRQEKLRKERGWASLAGESYHVLNTVISEETGELAQAILECGRAKSREAHKVQLEGLRDEAIQVAAMAAMIAEKAVEEMAHWNDPQAAS